MSHEPMRPVRPHITKIVIDARAWLDVTQVEFARLLGVHPLTVSKWERGAREPNAHQLALIKMFKKAARDFTGIGKNAVASITDRGVAYAIYMLLGGAFARREE